MPARRCHELERRALPRSSGRRPSGGLRRLDFGADSATQRECARTSCHDEPVWNALGPCVASLPVNWARRWRHRPPSGFDTLAPTGTRPWNLLRAICGRRSCRAVPPSVCEPAGSANAPPRTQQGPPTAGVSWWRHRVSAVVILARPAGRARSTGLRAAHRVRRKRRLHAECSHIKKAAGPRISSQRRSGDAGRSFLVSTERHLSRFSFFRSARSLRCAMSYLRKAMDLLGRVRWFNLAILTATPGIWLYGMRTTPLRAETLLWALLYYVMTMIGAHRIRRLSRGCCKC